jgi:hypothetical protein
MDAQYYIDGEGRDEIGSRYFRIALPESAITVSAKTVVSEPGHIFAARLTPASTASPPVARKR